MPTSKNAIGAMLAATHKIRVGDTLYIYDEESKAKVEKEIERRMLRSGDVRHNPNGTKEWYEWEAIVDTTKTGSAMFQWDKTGNLIKSQLMKITKVADGTVAKIKVRTAYRY